ncbi:MAG: hypothetical protein QOJ99_1499, partial [Bryobacterales bacterium]|nr:hypothetical protein [Bryobacterales bacterium]
MDFTCLAFGIRIRTFCCGEGISSRTGPFMVMGF